MGIKIIIASKEFLLKKLPKDERSNSKKEIFMNIPIGNIIYEIAISFGDIHVSYMNKTIALSCDQRGKSLDHWMHKQLLIQRSDLENLIKDYRGECHLKSCFEVWKKLVSRFEDIEWMSEMKGAFY
jgi:hypothetical protein